MPIAALYDIHGNLPALEAVLQDARRAGVDQILVGGDIVPGPMPRETLESLLKLDIPTQFIQGNGDREVAARMAAIDTGTVPERFRAVMDWVAQQLLPEQERVLAGWPETVSVDIAGIGTTLFCHATPRNNTEVFTRATEAGRLAPAFMGVDANLVVCGHTHMQFERVVGSVRIVNAGSIGMPYGAAGAHWVLLGPDVRFQNTRYDAVAAAERIRLSGYPQAEDFSASNLLHPPSEAEALEAFGKVELR